MKNLLLSLLLASAGLFAAIPAQAAVTFSLDTTTTQIQVGDYFDVDVVVHDLFANDATDELLGFGLNAISSDTGLLQLTGSTLNPLFENISPINPNVAGLAFPGISNSASIAQAFTLATLHFQAQATGHVSIGVNALANADLNQGLIFMNQAPVAISTSRSFDITTVPLPSGLLLFASGLAMSLGAFRKGKA